MHAIYLKLLFLSIQVFLNFPYETPKVSFQPELLVALPERYNTPDGATLGPDDQLYISVPNFNNGYLLENGLLTQPEPAYVIRLDEKNNLEEFYEFKASDLHPETGFMGPMDLAFGPDGNLYVADMQLAYNPMYKSRLLRINIENGQPTGVDVVVEGFIACNGVIWKNNTLYVTESILEHRMPQNEIIPRVSGVYSFSLEELSQSQPIQLQAFGTDARDPHLTVLFERNSMGFGADGLVFDDAGYLYTTVAGAVYKTLLGPDNKEVYTELFAENPEEQQFFDGIVFHSKSQQFFTVGFFENALYSIDLKGNIKTLHQNGDTNGADGSLDQPAEVVLRNKEKELVIVNMDLGGYSPVDVNSKPDQPYTLSRVNLKHLPKAKVAHTDRALHTDAFSMLVKLQVHQPQHKAMFEEALIADVAGAHTEKGNIAMELYQDKSNPNTYFIYEIWENRGALDIHFAKPWTQAAFAAGAKAQAQTTFICLRDLDPLPEKKRKYPNPKNKDIDDLIVFFKVKPEQRNRFVEEFRNLTRRSRDEQGVLAFHLYEVMGKPNEFVLYERWANEQAHLEHIERDYVKQLFKMFQETLVDGFELNTYQGLHNTIEISPSNRKS